MTWNLDIAIVAIFMIGTLLVGCFSGKGVSTTKDYAVANKSYNPTILMFSLIATMIGGGTITGDTAEMYSEGIIYFLALLGYTMSGFLVIKLIIPKIDERFKDAISTGDIITKMYGSNISRVSTITAYCNSILIIALQIVALGSVARAFLGVDFFWGALISGSIVTVYASIGGIKSVTKTDVMQLIVLSASLPLIIFISLNKVGGVESLMLSVPSSFFDVFSHKEFDSHLLLFLFFLMPFGNLNPSWIQRCLMTSENKNMVKVNYGFVLFNLLLTVMLLLIAMIAVVNFPNISANDVMPSLIATYFPVGLKGFAIAGLLAAIMSTTDSETNTASILLTHDVIRKKRNKLFWLKANTFITGAIAIAIGLQEPNIASLWVKAQTIFICTVGVPLFAGFMKMKISKESYLASVIFGIVSFAYSSLALDLEKAYYSGFIAIISSVLGFMLVHIKQNKGIVFLQERKNKTVSNKAEESSFTKFVKPLLRKMRYVEPNYIFFGVFGVVNYILPLFLWSDHSNRDDLIILRFIAVLLCATLLIKEILPRLIKNNFHIVWYITIIFCLPFLTTVYVVSNYGSTQSLINLCIAIYLLSALVNWVQFVTFLFAGVFIGVQYQCLFVDIDSIVTTFSYSQQIFYVVALSTVVGVFFNRKREVKEEDKLEAKGLFANAIAHEVKAPMNIAMQNLSLLSDEALSKKAKRLVNNVYNAVCDTRDNTNLLLKQIKFMSQGIGKKEPVNITNLLEEVKGSYQGKNIIIKRTMKNAIVLANYDALKILIYNLVNNSIDHSGKDGINLKITIDIRDKVLIFRDNGKGISQDKIPLIFNMYYTDRKQGTGIGLAYCKQIMSFLNGSIKCNSTKGKYTEFVLSFEK